MSASATATPSSHVPRSRRLWVPLAAPAAVWAGQGLLGWYIASQACSAGEVAPGRSARALVAVLTAAALVVSVGACVLAWRRYKRLESAPGTDGVVIERASFLSFAGFLVAAALTLGLVFAGLPALILRSCETVR